MARTQIQLLAGLAVATAFACGSTPPLPPDGGVSGVTEPPSYWGFAGTADAGVGSGLCWRYDDGTHNNYFTVAVDHDTTTFSVTTWHLTFRNQGILVREDYLQVSDDNLLLWEHIDDPSTFGATQIYSMYSPPPVFLQAQLASGSSVTTNTTATESGGSASTVPLTFLVSSEGEMPVTAAGTMQQATEYFVSSYSDADGGVSNETVDQFWFTPDVGIVQIKLDNTTTTWTLTESDTNVASTACVPP